MKEEACVGVVSEAWELGGARGEGSVAERLRSVAGSLHSWSVNMLGDLEKRMKKLKKELEKCRRSPIDDASVHREAVLIYRLDKVEEQKDIFWRQHAHADWLEKGDRNTSFFHKWCSERKRRNRIGRLKKEDGGWVEEELEKQDFIADHFMQLFKARPVGDTQRLLQAVSPKVTAEMNNDLVWDFSHEEVKCALAAIGDMKAPGPGGMPALFYKQYWEASRSVRRPWRC